jgi:broad specificity phosphatase PhoE
MADRLEHPARRRVWVAILAALLPVTRAAVGVSPAPSAAPPTRPQPLPADLHAALREGGCVLLMRHAQTEPGIGDPPGWRLDACSTQRNLSPEGRLQARRLGETLQQAAVRIGPVRSSAWCRCIDTATLAFGSTQTWPVLNSFFGERATEPAQTAALRDWIAGFRGPDNAALVTHQVNVTALTGEGVAMGEVLVLRPVAGGSRLIGRFVP